jgi:hypothetical protein
MPKDEFDVDDPLELNGVTLGTDEDTTGTMCECFIEEFMRMAYSPSRLLALFRNPQYTGLNMIMANRGEAFVRQMVEETFARWGRRCVWSPAEAGNRPAEVLRAGAGPELPELQAGLSCRPLTDSDHEQRR